MLEQEEQGSSTALGTATRAAHTMDVVIGVIRRVELNYPVDFREIKTSLCDIGAEENASLRVTELEVGGGAFLLFLLAVNVLNRNVDVVEQVRVELDRVAARHEDHNLFVEVSPQESEQ